MIIWITFLFFRIRVLTKNKLVVIYGHLNVVSTVEEFHTGAKWSKLKRIKNNKNPTNKSKTETTTYYRDPYHKEPVKRLAEGNCQLCKEPAPIAVKEGKPYLDEHHVVQLANGGKDSIENVVAICPNCHRKVQVLNNEDDIKKLENVAEENENKVSLI